MTDIPFVVIYHSDQFVPTQADVDRAARFMAMTLHRSAGPRHAIYYEGKRLNFDASDSGRWTNSIPAQWDEPEPVQCTFTWFDDEGVKQQCPLTADHPWDEEEQEVPHSAKGITKEQARALVRGGISSEAYVELARRFDPETGIDAPMTQPTGKAAKEMKATKKAAKKRTKAKPKVKPTREIRAK